MNEITLARYEHLHALSALGWRHSCNLPNIVDHWSGLQNRLFHLAKTKTHVEWVILSHGAGLQTSIIYALASRGYFKIDLALFADVGDLGTPCEWPETLHYLKRLHFFPVRLGAFVLRTAVRLE